MVAATLGSLLLDMWDEAAFLVFLYGTAEGIEEYAYTRTRSSIRELLKMMPSKARVLRNEIEKEIPAEELRIGDYFIVKPGELIPTDGIIVDGKASIDESTLTGESIPVEKEVGMKVFAGTINLDGILVVNAIATFKDSSLSKLIKLVEEAQEQKSRTQLFIERFGGKIYSSRFACITSPIFSPPIFGLDSELMRRGVVLLVAAAPCALVMSTPIAIAAGIGRASRSGVLIKGGIHLENLGKIDVVAFDKTGTLTIGKPTITDVVPLNSNQEEFLRLAYTLERFSEHPLAKQIVEKAEEMGLKPLEVEDFKVITGVGVKAKIDGKEYYAGKSELFGEKAYKYIEKFSSEGKTAILIGDESDVEGIIAFQDEVRQEAKKTVEELHKLGIKAVMLTGDNERVARTIAKEVGIDFVRANLKPEDKVEVINNLKREFHIAMVGDGINDAPALATATVGIAMGVGADVAIEAADVALTGNDLLKVPYAINLGEGQSSSAFKTSFFPF